MGAQRESWKAPRLVSQREPLDMVLEEGLSPSGKGSKTAQVRAWVRVGSRVVEETRSEYGDAGIHLSGWTELAACWVGCCPQGH